MIEIINFWFGDTDSEIYGKYRPQWFQKDEIFDYVIRENFLDEYHEAAIEMMKPIPEKPLTYLALIILLDQFPRNMFRNTPQAFATDHIALKYATEAVDCGYDKQLLPVQRWFIYLPFEHSENIDHQRRNLVLMSDLKNDPETQKARVIEYAQKHFDVIDRFGRFPHRNHILDRTNTSEEEIFLGQPGSSF